TWSRSSLKPSLNPQDDWAAAASGSRNRARTAVSTARRQVDMRASYQAGRRSHYQVLRASERLSVQILTATGPRVGLPAADDHLAAREDDVGCALDRQPLVGGVVDPMVQGRLS